MKIHDDIVIGSMWWVDAVGTHGAGGGGGCRAGMNTGWKRASTKCNMKGNYI